MPKIEISFSHASFAPLINYHTCKYFRPMLKDIQNATETRILLHCAKDNIIPILRKAENLHLMGDYYAYVIVSLVRMLFLLFL